MKSINPNRKKLFLLIAGCIAFIFICYCLAFKKTAYEIKAYKANKQQLTTLEESPIQLQLLEKRIKELENDIYSGSPDGNNYQVYLLKRSTSLIKGTNIKVVELPRSIIARSEGISVQTQLMVLQGSFFELLGFLNTIGKDKTVGNICSVDFYSQKDTKSKTSLLNMKIYFQFVNQDKQQ